MSGKFDCILINGDSYSALHSDKKVYSQWLAEQLNIPVKNVAAIGCSNQRILRSSIEHVKQLREEFQNPLVLIGWSFVHRLEVWYPGNNEEIIKKIPDTTISPGSKLITLDWVLNSNEATIAHKALVDDIQVPKQLTDFYTNLYMFGNLLESMNLDYRFFSAARNIDCSIKYYPHLHSLTQSRWVTDNPRILKLHEFCISTWAKDNDPECDPVTGHLSESGHQKFAEFLIGNVIV